MTLFLQGIALNDERLSQPLLGRFDERGGTMGRSDTATFTLPDPERRISRVQAKVLFADGGYWIENSSAASPVLHNGRLLGAGMRVALQNGDELRIGGYTLVASFEDDPSSATILRGRTVVPGYEAVRSIPTMPMQASAKPSLPATPVIPSGRSTADADNSWRAFLQAAGLDAFLPAKPTPELMGTIGTMLRTAVEGIHRLVAMRAMAKDEMHTDLTMIQARDNNPLKFAPDADVALKLLLQPAARGFLDGPAALRAALVDLQSHQVGMAAGMRSAVETGLDRFDPAKLEAQLSARSVLDSFLPAHRRARLWELYLEHYRSLREEAQDDFQRFFGEAFREAYEAQVRNLNGSGDTVLPAGARPRDGLR